MYNRESVSGFYKDFIDELAFLNYQYTTL